MRTKITIENSRKTANRIANGSTERRIKTTADQMPLKLKEHILTLQRTRLLMVFIILLTVTTAWTLSFGPDIIRECPKCKTALKQLTFESGNTFGGQLWSDGKMIAPMTPNIPLLVKCPKCVSLIWIDEAKKLGTSELYKDNKWPNAVAPKPTTEADFLLLLSSEKLSVKKELCVRRLAWWAANDVVRTNKSVTVKFTPAQKANLLAMTNLLDEKDPDQRIRKAEIFRELKKFDECIKLLVQPFNNARHNEVSAFIRKLAEQKLWTVCKISETPKTN